MGGGWVATEQRDNGTNKDGKGIWRKPEKGEAKREGGGEVFNACEDANAGKEERMERRREEWETTVKRNQDEDEGWG